MKTLYQELKEAGAKMSSHYSDLYVEATPENKAIIDRHNKKPETFINQVEGGLWYDVPFSFDPYWEERCK